MVLSAGEDYYVYIGGDENFTSEYAEATFPISGGDFDIENGSYNFYPPIDYPRMYNIDQLTAITDTSTGVTLGESITVGNQADYLTREEAYYRGYRVNPNVDLHGFRCRIAPNVSGAHRGMLLNSDVEILDSVDLTTYSGGDTFDLISVTDDPDAVGSTVSWETGADWADAQARDDVVTRDVGIRSSSQVWLGWDPEIPPMTKANSYWTLDEMTPAVEDEIGDAHGTEYGNVSQATGVLGSNSAVFDGVDNYISLGNPSSLAGSGAFTLVMAVRRDTLDARQTLFSHGFVSPGDWTLEVRDNSRLHFFFTDSSGTLHSGSFHAGKMGTDWHYVGLVFRDSGNDTTVYLDDEPQHRAFGGSGRPAPSGPGAAIGRFANREYYYFDGLMSDVVYFDRALSSSELNDLYDPFFDGYLRTGKKEVEGAAQEVEVDVDMHPNASLQLEVHLDSSGSGSANQSEVVEINRDGRHTYDLSNFATGGIYWAMMRLNTTSFIGTPKVSSIALHSQGGGGGGGGEVGAGSVLRTSNGVLLSENGVLRSQ